MNCGGWFLYVLRCADDTLYTGVTTDLARRLNEHNSGRGARYTSGRCPVHLVGSWPFADRSSAQRAEAEFRLLSRKQKVQRIAERMPFSGSAFCHGTGEERLSGSAPVCSSCGELLRSGRRVKDGRARWTCTACRRFDGENSGS